MQRFAKTIVAGWVAAIAAIPVTIRASDLFTVSPETTVITQPLRPDGSVDYVAAINERQSEGVTPENNGFVLWLKVIGADALPQSTREQTLKMCGAHGLRNIHPIFKDYGRDTPIARTEILRLWKPQDDPAFAEYLAQQTASLDMAVQAANKPRWWMPRVSLNGSLTSVLLPELNFMRVVSWTLCERALFRAEQGDFDGFMTDVIAVKRLAAPASEDWLVGNLVAIGLNRLADETIGAAVGAGKFSSEQCAKLAAAMDNVPPPKAMWETMDQCERWSPLDMVQCIAAAKAQLLASGNSADDKWLKPFKTLDCNSVDWNAVLKRMNALSDEMVAILRSKTVKEELTAQRAFDRKIAAIKAKQARQINLDKKDGETTDAYSQRIGDAIIVTCVPSLSRAEATYRKGAIREALARAIVPAGQYHAEKQKWPDRIDDLTPQYLPASPKDALVNLGAGPVRYQHRSAGISLHARDEADPSLEDISVGIR
jgi:hypothetical protein